MYPRSPGNKYPWGHQNCLLPSSSRRRPRLAAGVTGVTAGVISLLFSDEPTMKKGHEAGSSLLVLGMVPARGGILRSPSLLQQDVSGDVYAFSQVTTRRKCSPGPPKK